MKNKKRTKKNVSGISKKMTFGELMEKHPETVTVLFENGLHCISCGMAMLESIEDGCKAHGMSKKEIDELIKKLEKVK